MDNPINKLIEHFSQWNDLKRGVAWLFKLKDVLKTKLKRKDVDKMVAECHVQTNHLPVEDLARADQGTNFISSQRELSESLKSLNYDTIHDMLAMEGVKWEFNPPITEEFGKDSLNHLKRFLQSLFHEQTLDDEGLSTVCCEVEAIMNVRPLTMVSNDPNYLEPLTPNHLLHMKAQPVMPTGVFESKMTCI